MNLFSRVGLNTRLGKVAIAVAALCVSATAAAVDTGNGVEQGTPGVAVRAAPSGPTTGPLTNDSVGSAHMLVPDGSSLHGTFAGGVSLWYDFLAEPGKTYAIDFFDPYSDDGLGPSGIALFNSDGTTSPTETQYSCSQGGRAPAVSPNFGFRCVLRMFAPQLTALQNRKVYIRVDPFFTGEQFQLRVTEATIYGRWTTNTYDFHIEMQNTTGQSVCAQIWLYGNSGLTYSAGSWGGPIEWLGDFTIPAYGANKTIVPSGHLVGTDNRGTWRIHACAGGPQNFTPGALNVSAYGFNPVTKQFLFQPSSGPNGSFSGNAGSY